MKKTKKTGEENQHSASGSAFSIQKLHNSKLFKQYFLLIIIIVIVAVSISGTITVSIFEKSLKKQQMNELQSSAENIAKLSGDLLSVAGAGNYVIEYENSLNYICFTIKEFSENSDTDIFVVNTSGKVILCKELFNLQSKDIEHGSCLIHRNIEIPEEMLEKIRTGELKPFNGTIDGLPYEKRSIAAAPIFLSEKEQKLGGYVFAVHDYSAELTDTLKPVRTQVIVSATVTLFIAIAIIYLTITQFARPLQEILYATRQFAKGDFSYRIHEQGIYDELHELTRAFNTMANDLSSIENSRRNFIANVSHELKTPMTTIGGFIDGILDGTIPPSQHKKYLQIVSDEVRRLSRLITSMLNMSKIEAGELTPSYTKFDAADMIVRTLLSFEQIISQHNINITGLDSMEELMISADPDMINQVIYNIIDNAVKFTPEGGEIHVSSHKKLNRAIIKVRNYGVGIANNELKMIFDRFYKVDKSRSLNTKSVGLGLYICKNIIELHNGKIYATSENDQYTEFTIELPLWQK